MKNYTVDTPIESLSLSISQLSSLKTLTKCFSTFSLWKIAHFRLQWSSKTIPFTLTRKLQPKKEKLTQLLISRRLLALRRQHTGPVRYLATALTHWIIRSTGPVDRFVLSSQRRRLAPRRWVSASSSSRVFWFHNLQQSILNMIHQPSEMAKLITIRIVVGFKTGLNVSK